uniref:Methyltransferase FkbM domain-containing protein n=1 Tax=uncultured archaeon Rifle_16ft_4_minimus_37913 TaxID=1665152 RepID=A0A0H4T938_9ARCH|nr:hypothetical protein [uncultured archaeon Rifle_16ft_4_minimus_37913]
MRIKLFMKPVTTLLGIKLSLENSQVKERFSHFGVRFGKHWEDPERDLILRYLPTGEDFIDLGGCIGFVSLLARKFKHTKKHIIVEGNPSLMGTINRNLALNNEKDIIPLNRVYSKKKGKIDFIISDTGLGNSSVRGKVQGKKVRVKAISLKGIMKTYKIKRFNLLCDIEGNEEELIESEIELLKKYCNFLIIDFDIPYLRGKLIDEGFRLLDENKPVCIFKNEN